jgi:hypothetical protein
MADHNRQYCIPCNTEDVSTPHTCNRGRTYHDVTHALAVQDARAAVVDAAKAYIAMVKRIATESYTEYKLVLEALEVSVAALDAVERGEP